MRYRFVAQPDALSAVLRMLRKLCQVPDESCWNPEVCTPGMTVHRKVHFCVGIRPTGAKPTGVNGHFVHRRNGIASRICLALPMQARPNRRTSEAQAEPARGGADQASGELAR